MKKFTIYNGKIWGNMVSEYGVQNGYMDYRTLANIVGDMILNNNIFNSCEVYEWELESGVDYIAYDEEGNEIDPCSEEEYDRDYIEVFQYYIISDRGAEILKEFTNEIVYYNEKLDMYLWGITHFGTGWDYVLTDLKLSEMERL